MVQKQIDPRKVNKIFELFESGSTIADIVARVGTNRETIRRDYCKLLAGIGKG